MKQQIPFSQNGVCVCAFFFETQEKREYFKKRKKKKSEKSREYVVRIVKYTYLYDHIQEIIYLSPHFSLCLINILNLILLFIIIFDFQQQLRMFFNQLFLKLIKGIFFNIIIIKQIIKKIKKYFLVVLLCGKNLEQSSIIISYFFRRLTRLSLSLLETVRSKTFILQTGRKKLLLPFIHCFLFDVSSSCVRFGSLLHIHVGWSV